MWWPSRAPSEARAFAGPALALFLLLPLLAACGFQPVYGGGRGGTELAELQQVRIAPIGQRRGQQLHNALRDRINPQGQPGDPAYRLVVALEEGERRSNVRPDATATRITQRLTAYWELRRIAPAGGAEADPAGERVLLEGRSRSFNSYDVLDQPYATTVAERDATERGVRSLANDIHTRVAAYLARPGRAQAARQP
jgi:LPS-assembly lipoprotein